MEGHRKECILVGHICVNTLLWHVPETLLSDILDRDSCKTLFSDTLQDRCCETRSYSCHSCRTLSLDTLVRFLWVHHTLHLQKVPLKVHSRYLKVHQCKIAALANQDSKTRLSKCPENIVFWTHLECRSSSAIYGLSFVCKALHLPHKMITT